MASLNKVLLLGNVTRDVVVKHLASGNALAELGLAVNREWFDKAAGTNRSETAFIDVTLWGRDAEVASEHLSKGRSVLIEGRLQLDSWDDKTTGQKRSKLKVVAEKLTLIGERPAHPGNERLHEPAEPAREPPARRPARQTTRQMPVGASTPARS